MLLVPFWVNVSTRRDGDCECGYLRLCHCVARPWCQSQSQSLLLLGVLAVDGLLPGGLLLDEVELLGLMQVLVGVTGWFSKVDSQSVSVYLVPGPVFPSSSA